MSEQKQILLEINWKSCPSSKTFTVKHATQEKTEHGEKTFPYKRREKTPNINKNYGIVLMSLLLTLNIFHTLF